MDKHQVLMMAALICCFLEFIRKPTMPVSIGWLGVCIVIFDLLLR